MSNVTSIHGATLGDATRERLIASFAESYDEAVQGGFQPTGAGYVFISDEGQCQRGYDMSMCAIPANAAMALTTMALQKFVQDGF